MLIFAKFIRVRVMVDILKPLRRGILMKIEGRRMWVKIKYESLANFCYCYGKLGHVELDCEDVEAKETQGEYGDWLRASPLKLL